MAIVKFNAAIEEIRGKSGGANYARTQYGIEFRNNPTVKKPATPAQIAQRARVSHAGSAFRALTAAQNAAWQAYAATQSFRTRNGALVRPSAYSVFMGLYTKFVQVTPDGTLTAPPTAPFVGDTITLTATGSNGKVTFTASAANAARVTTELLLQPLANVYRKPQSGSYAGRGFFTFATGSLSHAVETAPGAYAAAYRFVNSATGQEVSRVTLGTVVVS